MRYASDAAGTRARQVTPQDAQRRRAREGGQRRQREAEEQQDARAERGERRHESGSGQIGCGDAAEEVGEQLRAEQREHDAGRPRDHAEHGELQDEQRERAPTRRAEAAHHRGGVEVAAQIARRGERDRHCGEDHGDERREPEESLGALERLPHLGPQVADILHALARLELGGKPAQIAVERAALRDVGDQEPPRGAVARLQQIRRRHVVEIDEQARPERQQSARDLRLLRDDRRHLERGFADRDAIARGDPEARGEPRVGPCLAAPRNSGGDHGRRIVGARE